MIDVQRAASAVERFLDERAPEGSDLSTLASPTNIQLRGQRTAFFNLPALGALGIFTGIIIDPILKVTATEMETVIHIQVGMHYSLNNRGTNGNSIVALELDIKDFSLRAYRYEGQEPVYIGPDAP